MTKKKQIGDIGESLAKKFLTAKGYVFIFQNYRCLEGEIDLVFQDPWENQLMFVEVKTRTFSKYGNAEDSVDYFKLLKIQNAIDSYLGKLSRNENYRIDLVAVYLNISLRKAKIKHYKAIS